MEHGSAGTDMFCIAIWTDWDAGNLEYHFITHFFPTGLTEAVEAAILHFMRYLLPGK